MQLTIILLLRAEEFSAKKKKASQIPNNWIKISSNESIRKITTTHVQKKSNIYKILSLLEEEKASLINILRVIVGKKNPPSQTWQPRGWIWLATKIIHMTLCVIFNPIVVTCFDKQRGQMSTNLCTDEKTVSDGMITWEQGYVTITMLHLSRNSSTRSLMAERKYFNNFGFLNSLVKKARQCTPVN